jgi:hypothetical protein
MKEGVMNAGPWRIFTPILSFPRQRGKEQSRRYVRWQDQLPAAQCPKHNQAAFGNDAGAFKL